MAKKLSKVQQEIVDLMKEGWELGVSLSFSGNYSCRVQKDGLGNGGATKYFSVSTFKALENKGILKIKSNEFRNKKYALSETEK